ncbi:flowering-promoting factor 1-like [Malania oleifera]|uniref:flowering-promoting factor 1-like n=1 Tax=Malania oleifera TaxID=397392 RepID=UPI0025AEB566|nr:flowering-promoting factor 1-like [Malania oleifera]
MSGVWVFDKNGVVRLVSNPTRESFEQSDRESARRRRRPGTATAPGARPRVLVYLPANQVIRSYAELEQRLNELGWTRYRSQACPHSPSTELIQFHRSDQSAHLISLPKTFAHFKPLHMYDIVVKNRSFFEVRDP